MIIPKIEPWWLNLNGEQFLNWSLNWTNTWKSKCNLNKLVDWTLSVIHLTEYFLLSSVVLAASASPVSHNFFLFKLNTFILENSHKGQYFSNLLKARKQTLKMILVDQQQFSNNTGEQSMLMSALKNTKIKNEICSV